MLIQKLTYVKVEDIPFEELLRLPNVSVITFRRKDGEEEKGALFKAYNDEADEHFHWRWVTKSMSYNLCAYGCKTYRDCVEYLTDAFDVVEGNTSNPLHEHTMHKLR